MQEVKGLKERIGYNEDFKLDWHDPDEVTDGYQLKWIGKDYARLQSGMATETVIIPDTKHNEEEINKNSENLFFTGDNLEVLRHLQNAYANSIKMIYIDPPYNTGKEFVYNDTFEYSDEKLKDMLGMTDDEIKRLHTINGRSSHSAWLTFMYPRLKIARKLLTDDGVIFISIDDNEQANLKLLCDEIFGENNFLGEIIWQTATDNNKSQISIEHEYVICYAKNIINQDDWSIESDKAYRINDYYQKLKAQYSDNIDKIKSELRKWIRNNKDELNGVSHYNYVDDKGVYYPGNSANTRPGGYDFDIIHPITKNICSKPQNGYRWPEETFYKAANKGDVEWGEDENTIPKIKKRIETATELLKSTYYEDNRYWTNYIKELFGGKVFDNPKSVNLLKKIISFTATEKSIVLDFFAGSASTAEAVMQINAKKNKKISYIMVQERENTYTIKNDIKVAKEECKIAYNMDYNSIDEISRKRIELAGEKIKEETNADIDYGFKHYYVKESNVETINKIVEFNPKKYSMVANGYDMVKEFDNELSTGLDVILTTWLMADGYKLNQEIKEIDFEGYKAHYIDNSLLYLINPGWKQEQTKKLVNMIGERKLNVNTVIVYGYSFSLNSMKELEISIKNFDNRVQIEKRY